MLGDCAGERLIMEIVLRYWSVDLANKLKSQVLVAKYPCGVFLRKNVTLGELGHRGFLSFLVIDYACCNFMTIKKAVFGEDNVLEFCGGT